ncbi:related to SRP101-signal recognition particle receptor, alpha chain [Serendipita indica DSM 11827]|uniref:Related to SRP101-signal recognition particle receptor, alpha chain n=1 Tax=Serendipita indica (strain DSM 11827) TaxID=1109443 RepID=G4T745_SERID|nr:related to SRP101-signal recognition particle receptor, alpha chain [Serendipita indica DSM 11827]
MLDNCTISHKGGLVLWSRSFTPTAATLSRSNASPVNNLIREALIEGRSSEDRYEKDGYAVRWTLANDLELIFVVAYQRILQLSYVEDLLTAIKTLFIKLYAPFLTKFVASLHAQANAAPTEVADASPSWDFASAFKDWDKVFDKVLRELEQKANQERRLRTRQLTGSTALGASMSGNESFNEEHPERGSGATTPAKDATSPLDGQEIAKNIAHLKTRMKGRNSTSGKKGKGGGAGSGSDSDVSKRQSSLRGAKSKRTWGDVVPTEDDMSALDFSTDKPSDLPSAGVLDTLVDEKSRGVKKDGVYEIRDWEFSKQASREVDEDLDDFISKTLRETSLNSTGPTTSSEAQPGYISSLFSKLTGLAGSTRPLTQQDLGPVLAGMKEHLMKKNVARDIAERVCDGVGKSLEGKKVGGLRSIRGEVHAALEDAITRILTPKTSTDILHAIRQKKLTTMTTTRAGGESKMEPYSITFVGVNGVGKSTNLSKVAFWLLQNDFRVLIAACDTFRSGAVEQLRVHVRNLGMLVNKETVEDDKGKKIDLYEKGYGKDAAGIAKDAIAYAKEEGFDVVLIDTAGRMQDNEPLMRALAKLVALNQPDKIVFVGEALVGNEAVDQLTKFDRALKDFSKGEGKSGRGIDGMLVTKWDTVDDKVGAALSMTFVTGQPILFVGCGQTYTDLRQLRVSNVVQALLSD